MLRLTLLGDSGFNLRRAVKIGRQYLLSNWMNFLKGSNHSQCGITIQATKGAIHMLRHTDFGIFRHPPTPVTLYHKVKTTHPPQPMCDVTL